MDIEYGCYVSNRYGDFLNVSENESHCRNDAIIANGKQKNRSKQRKKKNVKRAREQLSGEITASAIENGKGDTGAVNAEVVIEKPLAIALGPAKEIVTEMVEVAQQMQTIDTDELVQPNVPIVEPTNDAIENIANSTEVKWSQICIEEDKAIAEQHKMASENGERKFYPTVFFYNSNFGNGNCFVRLGENFRYRRRDKMQMIVKNGRPMTEKSESEHTESVNDSNNNEVGEMENGKSDLVNNVPKKRKRTKKKHRKRVVKMETAADATIDGDVVANGDAVPNGDAIPNREGKLPIRKYRKNKYQRMHKSHSIEMQSNELVNQQPRNNDEISIEKQNVRSIGNSGHASSQTNNNNISPATNPDNNHILAAKTTDAVNVNKPKRSRFSRRKQNAATQKIESTEEKQQKEF